VRRLRDALGDSADAATFIETLPRRGYRFTGTITEPPAAPEAASQTGTVPEHLIAAPAVRSGLTSGWKPASAAILLTVVAISAAIVVARMMLRPEAVGTAWQTVPTRLTFDDGLQTEPSLAPDGQTVAYASDRSGNFDVWTQRIAGGNPVQVTVDQADEWQPDWSPDGNQIVFRSERGTGGLLVAPATGGATLEIAAFGYRPQWSPDGTRILFARSIVSGAALGLHVVALDGSPPRPLPEQAGVNAFGWETDGRCISLMSAISGAFVLRLSSVDRESLAVTPWIVEESVQRGFVLHQVAVEGGETLAWDPSAAGIYFVGASSGIRGIWRVDVDAVAKRLVGGPHRVTALPHANSVSLSGDGHRLVFDGSSRTARIWSYALNGAAHISEGAAEALTPAAAHADAPDLSRDGTQLVYMLERPGSRQRRELVARSMIDGHHRTLRVVDAAREWVLVPRWSRRATRLSYTHIAGGSAPDSTQQIRVLDLERGTDTALTSPASPDTIEFPSDWSPDESFVLSTGTRYVPEQSAIVLLPLAAAPHAEKVARVVTSVPHGNLYQASMSPDGRWIVFRVGALPGSPAGRLAVVSADGGDVSAWRMIASDEESADKPRWSSDGTMIYYTSGRGGVMNVWAIRFDSGRGVTVGTPFPITRFKGSDLQILPDVRAMELGVGMGRLVLPLVRPRGGIWMLEQDNR